MSREAPIGLLTGSAPFAGLPDSPAASLVAAFDGRSIGGVTIMGIEKPVSLGRLPGIVDDLVATHRPVFIVSLGLAPGEAVFRLETTAINRVDFGVADNEGARPTCGGPIEEGGPKARFATWDAKALASGLLDSGLPAIVSHHAGTHLCNLVLYCAVGAIERAGLSIPVGFLHLPYAPEQVARFLREGAPGGDTAPMTPRALPSLPMETQEKALGLILTRLAEQALG